MKDGVTSVQQVATLVWPPPPPASLVPASAGSGLAITAVHPRRAVAAVGLPTGFVVVYGDALEQVTVQSPAPVW